MFFSLHSFSRLTALCCLWAAISVARGAEPSAPAKPADVQKAVEQFNAQRERVLAEYQAQLDQLKGLTEEQRRQILEKMQEQRKAIDAAQRAQGKQIREDLRKLRQSSPGRRA